MDVIEIKRRPGLDVQMVATSPGAVEIKALPDHRIRVHAGTSVRGRCEQHRFVYTRGDVDIIPAGQSDYWEGQDPGLSVFVQFAPELLQRTAQDLGLGSQRANLEPRHLFRDANVEHIVWALQAERQAGSPNGRLYQESLGAALAIHLLGRYSLAQQGQVGLSPRQLERVKNYIEAHIDQDLSLAMLAGVGGSSLSHFKTLFKRSMGLPVHEYVVQRRVERARVLLLRGDLASSQVALEAGFSHQSHMARCMRRVLGVSPGMLVRSA